MTEKNRKTRDYRRRLAVKASAPRKKIDIEIGSCQGCPYCQFSPADEDRGFYRCKITKDKTQTPKFIRDISLIPDWCPLENA